MSLEFWIDVESAAGVRYGPGPITTATGWQMTPRLDAAGTFSFQMPVSDPMSIYLANKRIVRCRGIMGGVVTELGAGIIDNVRLVPGNPTMQTVSGPDIMAELAGPSVHGLVIREQAWTDLSAATDGLVALVKQARDGTRSADATPLAHDGNDATANAFDMRRDVNPSGFPEANNWTYVGYDARWDAVNWLLKAGGRVNERNSRSRVQYYNGSGWVDEPIVSDGTLGVNGRSFEQSGVMTFARPADWARYNEAVVTGGNWFWRRFGVTVTSANEAIGTVLGGAYVDIAEVDVYADFPTTGGVDLIMAYAPDTWTKTGYPDTVSPKYLEFKGQTVLEALVILSEQGGTDSGAAVREHFRLGTGRAINWRGTTVNASGVRAVSPTDPIAAEGASELALIQALQKETDSAEVVTRIYPESADLQGIGPATHAAPTGYTRGYVTQGTDTYWYLQHTAGYNAYGLIERHVEFSELSLQQADSYTTHPIDLGNQLQERGAEYLRTHALANQFFRLSIVQFPALILPGDTIECVYHEWIVDPVTGAVHTVDIDTIRDGAPLHVLAPTLTIDVSGVSVQALEVATIDRAPKSDAGVVVDLVRQQKRGGVAASNLVTISGTVLPPPPGELGGWSIGDLAIENNDAVLHSDGWIQLGSGDNIIRMDAQDVGYRMWAGAPLGADAPFSITVDGSLHAENAYIEGEIVADTGTIGGWTIGAAALTGAEVILGSSGVLTLGTGNDIAVLDGSPSSSWKLWIGDAVPGDAPFRVDKTGALWATNANIEGVITALTGSIGGWTIASGHLYSGSGAGRVGLKPADYPFYAGSETPGSAPFRVTPEGVLTARSGVLGALDIDDTITLDTAGEIVSDNYAAGVAGLRIGADGYAEFQDVLLRGTLRSSVFETGVVSVTAGSLLLAKSGGALAADYTVGGTLTLAGDTWLLETGDIVRIRAYNGAGAVTDTWISVTRTATTNEYTTSYESGDNAVTYPAGTAVVGYDGTAGGLLYLTADDANGPFYSVRTHGAAPWTDTVEVARLGNLNGLAGISSDLHGLFAGDYAGGNYLRYEPTGGFVVSAGDGKVALDDLGLTLGQGSGETSRVKWVGDDDSTLVARIGASHGAGVSALNLSSVGYDATDIEGFLQLTTTRYDDWAQFSRVIMRSGKSGVDAQIQCSATRHVFDNSLSPYIDTTVEVYGTIRESVPIHMRLSRRTTDQAIPSGAWTPRFMNTIEYANAGSGIAGADLLWMHTPLVFTGTGRSDLTHLGMATYPESFSTDFVVRITAITTPNRFQFSINGGATWNGTDIAITGGSQTIGGTRNVRIQFGATTGYALNAQWRWLEHPLSMVVAVKAGLYAVTVNQFFPTVANTITPYRLGVSVFKNATTLESAGFVQMGAERNMDVGCTALVWLNAGEHIDSRIFHDSGVSKTAGHLSGVNHHWSTMNIVRIS